MDIRIYKNLPFYMPLCPGSLPGLDVQGPGAPCGSGLTEEAARELGLNVGTPVATSLIDTHAGSIGNNI